MAIPKFKIKSSYKPSGDQPDAINKLMLNKTSLVIAHKFSTIKKCNKILVLDKGKIIDEGSHDELIEKSAIYKNMYELQN